MGPFLERAELETLYDRHAPGVFNFCLRTLDSRDIAARATTAAFLADGRGEPRTELFAAARRECAGLVEAPHLDAEGPSSRHRVRDANGRLAVRHREVLALRELLGFSYEEVGAVVGAGRETVAELLWQARLALRDELQSSTLLSIAARGDSCGRALALVVMHWDGELHGGDDRSLLQRHLRTCGKCRLSQEAMREASAAYRDWPLAATPLGMRPALLAAAAGSERSSRHPTRSPPPGTPGGAPRSPR